jgi:hypothetical protein
LYLRKMTLIVIIGIVSSFSIRTFGTVFPQIFKNLFVVKASILINSFFILSHLLFWFFFYKEYASTKNAVLKKVCILAIIGSLAVSFLYIKNLPFVFEMNIGFPLFLMNPYIDSFVPLISSIFHLIFFMVFKYSLELEEERMLSRPISSIIVGISFILFFHLIVLINFLTTKNFLWLEHMPKLVSVGTIPLLIIAFLLILNFYYRFYYFLNSNSWNKERGLDV